jgi:3-hydroxybutyryl-CoA dehydratase
MQEGDIFNHTFVVTPAVFEGFTKIFNDLNPLHVDEDFAQGKGFRGRVMYGNILNGFLSYFIGECLPVKNVIILAQTIKYALPVYLGDELQFTAELAGVFESVHTYEFKYAFKNREGKKVAKGTIQIGLLQ